MKKSAAAILVCVLFLLSFGLVMLYSASYPFALRSAQYDHNPYWFLTRQLIWIGLGMIALGVTAAVDYARWRKLAWPLWGFALFLLLLVLVPGIGQMINGSRRWLRLGPVTIQPSELGKIAVIFFLAHYLDHWQRDVQQVRAKRCLLLRQKLSELNHGFVTPMLIMGVVVLAVFCEIDIGTGVLIGLVALAVIFLGGVRWWLLALSYIPAAAGLLWYLRHDPIRWERITAFLHLEEHKLGIGLQQWQAKLAFGSGGLTGVGIGQSRTKEHYLPYAPNDFIAPIIGEELGLVCMMLLVLTYVLFVAVSIYICSRARELYGFLLGMGIVTLISLQALINLAVVTAMMPNKGLPLPFISYGGSNLCVMLAGVGLLLSIARHAGTPEQVPASPDLRRSPAFG